MDNLKEIRWKQRFHNFEKSYKLIDKYSNLEDMDELDIAGLIQFFEVTLELAWKVMKDYLESKDFIVRSPRETIKEAFSYGIIDNGTVWLEALDSRNRTVHTYDQEFAIDMKDEILNMYYPEFKKLYKKLREEL
ncbi:MAG: nucleotidyltransferase [Clostridiales bacterium GWE2_32_10]|nr:MAG: nucleotidyltransferase [Clostridiales bacterium GWE2_32_10]HBY20299.1 nucleotidyltransferase [Clostridiales bacterium]